MQLREKLSLRAKISSAATLSGYLVRNSEGEDLGCIEELMVDPDSGKIVYAVVSLGAYLGTGDKLFAIPWRMLALDSEERVFVLETARDTLETAPWFSEENWPDFGDADWGHRVHNHFGLHPYWQAA
jgi:sporulation protein YlmC with PRC-barrel domain